MNERPQPLETTQPTTDSAQGESEHPDASARFTIGVYAASTQGFYFGELVCQIRQIAQLRGLGCVIVKTLSHGEFESPLACAGIDAFIIIKNSVSTAQARYLCSKLNKPCVSIGYDYFPLKIPVISSDHEFGMKLALDELIADGFQQIAFIGDLSQYDIRKRYEAYCDLHELYDLPIRDDYLFNVENALFSGGYQAAAEFVAHQCDATAVVAGAGLTGIGFYRQLSALAPEVAERLRVSCFDALSLIPVLTPQLSAVDANLHLVAYRAVELLGDLRQGKHVELQDKVQPRLIKVNQDPRASYSEFLATCTDLSGFHNPNYMKAVTANINDWAEDIVRTDLASIMSIAPLFKPFLSACVVTRVASNLPVDAAVQVIKVIRPDQVDSFGEHNAPTLALSDLALQPLQELTAQSADLCCHFPIQCENKTWGFISVLGHSANTSEVSSFFAFLACMEAVTAHYSSQINLSQVKHTPSTKPLAAQESAKIYWDSNQRITTWSEQALQLLGFTGRLDQHIYQNMDITDRVHSEDLDSVREPLSEAAQGKAVAVSFRIKPKKGEYINATLQTEAPQSQDDSVIFNFGLYSVDTEHGF